MATEKWDIDTSHSSVGFSVRHMVISKVHGHFTKWGGELALDLEDLARSSVSIEIDAASIDTREPKRDEHLRSPDFFDAEKFPKLTFKSEKIQRTGDDSAKVTGALTIHGVTREATLDVELGGVGKDPWGGQRAGFSAKTRINRKDFGLSWNQALEAGGVLVGENIDITIELQAKK